jgi:hypothetical protein
LPFSGLVVPAGQGVQAGPNPQLVNEALKKKLQT